MDGRDLKLTKALYWNRKSAVRIADEISIWHDIKRGLRQGCFLLHDLFNIYSEVIRGHLKELEGIRVGGKNINSLQYAYDSVLIANSGEKFQSGSSLGAVK